MLFRTIRLAGTAAVAIALIAPAAVHAERHRGPAHQYNHDRSGYDRDSRDGYGRDYDRRDGESRQRRSDRDSRNCDRGTGGTILGAIAGGLLGNAAVGRRGNNAAGALASAGIGALAGNAIDRDC